MTIKVTALRRAYYNGEIIKPGQVITIKGNNVPSWAKKVEKVKETETPKNQETSSTDNAVVQKTPETPATSNEADEILEKSEEELNKILDDLRTKALDLNILIDTENKTMIEQIKELTAKINKTNEGA